MKRLVHVYRAEAGARPTDPRDRKPVEVFEIVEPSIDKARALALAEVAKRHGDPGMSASVRLDGGISVTLRARA